MKPLKQIKANNDAKLHKNVNLTLKDKILIRNYNQH